MVLEIYLGFAGLACSLIYRIPQIYKLYKTESVNDISLWMIHVQNVSYCFYIAYGFLIADLVYIISSFVSVLQNFIILILYCRFRNRKQIVTASQSVV